MSLGLDELELIRRLRDSCFVYTSLALVNTVEHGSPTKEDGEQMMEALSAVAHAGYALVESAKARAN